MFFIHISLPSLLIISGFILLFPTSATLALMGAVCVHEAGHLLAILLSGEQVDGIRITPFGLIILRRHKICSYERDVGILLAGPFANLLIGLLFFRHPIPGLAAFSASCLSFFLINVLPVRSLDGGRALEALLNRYFPDFPTERFLKYLSFTVLGLLWLLSIYLLLSNLGGFSLFLFCFWLFASIFLK